MKNLSKKDLVFISLMLFSMFFGAGNLIFPPFLGQLSGNHVWVALAGFCISAVGLPILGVITVSKTGGLHALASRVHPRFALIFTILIYLSIGPFLGIPRAGSLAFEMGVSPFLPETFKVGALPLLLYTLAYFSLAFWLCLTPSKLVDRFGKVLTPILLVLITSIFLCSLFKPLGGFSAPKGDYVNIPLLKGFLEGYMTMDAIAALNFGIVISSTLISLGVTEEKSRISYSIRAGLIVGFLLTVIYGMLSYLGATSVSIAGNTKNGAETLTQCVLFLFGKPGAVILGIIFSLACLTTSVGLITSCSQYFTKLVPKVSYKTWVTILAFSSMIFANMGLTKILSISVPVLTAIYPMAIILIVLPFADKLFNGNSIVYACCMLFTGIVSTIDALNQAGLKIAFVSDLFNHLPFYTKGLGWLLPAIAGALLGFILSKLKCKQTLVTEEI